MNLIAEMREIFLGRDEANGLHSRPENSSAVLSFPLKHMEVLAEDQNNHISFQTFDTFFSNLPKDIRPILLAIRTVK